MTSLGGSSALGARYAGHNARRGRGFIYGGSERVGALRSMFGGGVDGPVLDLGCRDGALAAALGLPTGRTIGVDIDPQALAFALRSGLLANVCRANLQGALPFRTDAFGLVVAGEIVEHMPFPDEMISEIHRVLRPGGIVVGSVPNAFRLKNRLLFLSGKWFEVDPTHLHQFSVRSLETLLARHFTAVSIRPCVGRYARLWPRMMANDLVWSGVKP